MKIYAISKIPSIPIGQRGYRATWPYHLYFHGEKKPVVNRYGEKPYKPLPLIRNKQLMPGVFFASIAFIARSDIAHELAKFDSVDLNRCSWEAIYDLPIDEPSVRAMIKQFSVFGEDFDEWHATIKKSPAMGWEAPTYFEILVPFQEKLSSHFVCTSTFTLPKPIYKSLPPVRTCAQLHKIYPLVELTPYILCNEAVFAILQHHVSDPDLFTVLPFEVE